MYIILEWSTRCKWTVTLANNNNNKMTTTFSLCLFSIIPFLVFLFYLRARSLRLCIVSHARTSHNPTSHCWYLFIFICWFLEVEERCGPLLPRALSRPKTILLLVDLKNVIFVFHTFTWLRRGWNIYFIIIRFWFNDKFEEPNYFSMLFFLLVWLSVCVCYDIKQPRNNFVLVRLVTFCCFDIRICSQSTCAWSFFVVVAFYGPPDDKVIFHCDLWFFLEKPINADIFLLW